MTNQSQYPRGARAAALLAALAITPVLLSSCGGLSESDMETVDIPPAAPAGTAETPPAGGAETPASTRTPESKPAEKKPPLPPPYSLEDAEKYVVQSGDALSLIAAKYGVSTSDVMRANKLADPNKIRAGQTLLLPAKKEVPAETAAPETATPGVTTPGVTTPASGEGTDLKLPSITEGE